MFLKIKHELQARGSPSNIFPDNPISHTFSVSSRFFTVNINHDHDDFKIIYLFYLQIQGDNKRNLVQDPLKD